MSDPAPVALAAIAPTAERGWMWRRLFSWALATAMVALLAVIVLRLSDPRALQAVALMVCGELALVVLFYMGGATLTDIWRLISAVRTTRIVNEQLQVKS